MCREGTEYSFLDVLLLQKFCKGHEYIFECEDSAQQYW